MIPPKPALNPLCSGLVAALALLVQTAPTEAGTAWSLDKVYAERTAMRVADQRCKLFAPSVASALLMGEVQARDPAELGQIVEIAVQRGSTISCRDPALITEAGHVRTAFSSYARLQRLDFPGGAASWKADRTVLSTRVEGGRWALTTAAVRASASLRFGVVVNGGRLTLFAQPGAEPARCARQLARCVMTESCGRGSNTGL